ncbi:aminotransferase class I/II-fold pyridoxal phosphate-dependent enzyme [Domibacillus robiginosus]|uniref:aminotransferase class I/II-fold pyridoxal phosphate-dependent enzyme n=1 Tax=Domibacillus robiginosus TaxID=1071054 RepID=UPI00067CCCEE|nr:aminotransferase class I/II-fold pyridoxal phosphate-dependent enzyme [Domibacillus robiginosus]
MNHSRMPLLDALKKHKQKESVSFHVPGHKNGLLASWMDLSLDITELNGLDDLHAPEECIKESEDLLSDLHHTVESKFLVNGSTVGNLTMILGTLSKDDTVFVQRNCHKSVLNALKMAQVFPVFLTPDFDEHTQTAAQVSKQTLMEAYKKYPESKAVIFTYPTYYGITGSFQELAAVAKSHDSLVLVDEAHGAHFGVIEKEMPMSALELGADIVVQSAHKMLPAMTMGAYLHIRSPRIDRTRIHFYLQALQSSSPSYPIMASLDYARSYFASYTEKDHLYAMSVKKRVAQLLQLKGFTCIFVDDPYKLLVRADGLTGYELQHLLEAADIYIELADPYQVLFIFPLLKAGEKLFEKKVVQQLSTLPFKARKTSPSFAKNLPSDHVSTLVLPYNEHSCSKREAVFLKEAAGQIAAEMIIPYPPGIPLVMEGERISNDHVERIDWLISQGARFHGGEKLNEKKLVVFRKEN